MRYLSVMKRALPSPRSKSPAQALAASEVLSDYEQWLMTHYGSVGTYKDHAKSFLRRFREQGSLLNQLDTFSSRKSITGSFHHSIAFVNFWREKNIRGLRNDLESLRKWRASSFQRLREAIPGFSKRTVSAPSARRLYRLCYESWTATSTSLAKSSILKRSRHNALSLPRGARNLLRPFTPTVLNDHFATLGAYLSPPHPMMSYHQANERSREL